jgi:hypothetical protein
MKVLSFPEINDLENGQQIPSLTGKVKKVLGQLSGEGQYGVWWLQSFILTDDHDNEITCTWTGEDTVNELEGKNILIESTFNKKDQLVGIKREIKHKNGKKYECVKLDDRCKIKTLDGGGERTSAVSGEAETKSGHSDRSRDDPPPHSNGVDEARKHLMASCNLYCLCIDAVEKAIEPHFTRKITDELYQAAIGTLYIEASRSGMISKMPTTPLQKP